MGFRAVSGTGGVPRLRRSPLTSICPSSPRFKPTGSASPEHIQGVGDPHDQFSNIAFGGFLQDTWRVNSNLTLNYGVRYDVEFTPTFAAVTPLRRRRRTGAGDHRRHSARLQQLRSAHRTRLGSVEGRQDGRSRRLWIVLRSSAAGACIRFRRCRRLASAAVRPDLRQSGVRQRRPGHRGERDQRISGHSGNCPAQGPQFRRRLAAQLPAAGTAV